MQMVITLGVFFYAGYWLDGQIGWDFPVLAISLTFIALGGILVKLYKMLDK